MKYYLIPIRMATVENIIITSIDKAVEKLESLCTVGGNVKMHSHYGKKKIMAILQETKKTELLYDAASSLLGIYSK